MSKKNKDSSTLFELIAKSGGKIRGVEPADHKEAPQAPDAEESTAEHAPPAPVVPQPPPEAAEPPQAVAETLPEETSKPKRAQKKKKATPKRTAKASAEAPAKSAKKPKPQPEPPADEPPAEEPEDSAPLLAAAEQADKAAPTRMPAGLAPPARLRPKVQAQPQADGELPAISVPSNQFVGLAVAIVLMIAAFIVGFIAGRFTSPRRQQVASMANAAEQMPARIPGKYYLVIQEFAHNTDADLSDAWDIRGFCEKLGYSADVRSYKETGLIVLSFKPFDSSSSDEAIQFARRIEKLGLAYQILGGKYRFQQRRTANSPIDPHFERWIAPPAQE